MFKMGKRRKKGDEPGRNPSRGRGPGRPNEKLAKRILGKDTGRRVFGFNCSPDIHARMKVLAGELQVPIFALAEHLLQLSVGQVTKAKEDPEEREQLRRHLTTVHVEARTIEKFSWYDEEMSKVLNEDRLRRFEVDDTVHRIVIDFARKGMDPRDMPWYIDFGYHCYRAMANGQPLPKDLTAHARFRRRSPPVADPPASEKKDQASEAADESGE
jgi:hypothetical protein